MGPPTSLPPFSAIDVHNGHRQPLHVQTGAGAGRQPQPGPPFVSPLSASRKSISQSPTTSFGATPYQQNPNYPSYGSHQQSSHQYVDEPGPIHHGKQPTDPLSSSNVTSADSSDDEGAISELPTQGLVAPFVAIRGLADHAERVEVS